MPGEDQERFEDYLELEKFIEDLQTGNAAHPPQDLTPVQARIYQMGALFHAASPGADKLRPAFVAELQDQLAQEMQQQANKHHFSLLRRERTRRALPSVSRRSLLTGSAAVAASLALGAGVEHIVEQTSSGKTPSSTTSTSSQQTQLPPIVPQDALSTWQFVTTLDTLGQGAVRFATETVVGYVLRDTTDKDQDYISLQGHEPAPDKIIALSAACTHMGCIVQWESADRQFHCPCHGGIFTAEGLGATKPNTITYLLPLPRFETKVEDNKVYVRVPVNKK